MSSSLSLIVLLLAAAADVIAVAGGIVVGVRWTGKAARKAAQEIMETQEFRRKEQLGELRRRIIQNSLKVDEILRVMPKNEDGGSYGNDS